MYKPIINNYFILSSPPKNVFISYVISKIRHIQSHPHPSLTLPFAEKELNIVKKVSVSSSQTKMIYGLRCVETPPGRTKHMFCYTSKDASQKIIYT